MKYWEFENYQLFLEEYEKFVKFSKKFFMF